MRRLTVVAGSVTLSESGSVIVDKRTGRELARLCPQCTAGGLVATLREHFGVEARLRARGLLLLDVLVPHELAPEVQA